MTAKNRGMMRFVQASKFSWQGFKAAYQFEEAFRQEVWLTLILSPIAILLASNGIELSLLIGSLMLVLIVELLNSGIEAVVDRIGSEHHELSGRAKDIGAAAVMLALLNAVIIWVCIIIL